MKSSLFATKAVMIDGKYFRVEPLPKDYKERGPSAFKKAVAYRYESSLSKVLLPYRGVVDKKEDIHALKSEVGIWFYSKKHEYKMRIIFPRGKEELSMYSIDNERDIMSAIVGNEYTTDQFIDPKRGVADLGGDVFMPAIHIDDDPLNKIIKCAIRMKEAPFEPYGRRLEAMAADKSKKSSESSNIRNNTRRAIQTNTAMSPAKATVYCDTWQLEMCILVRDAEGSMHPMFDDGTLLAIYPNGEPFPIDPSKIVPINDMVKEAIDLSSSNDNDEDE